MVSDMTTLPAQPADNDLELLSAYIDNQLADHERLALETRIGAEPLLKHTLDELRTTVSTLRAVRAIAPPRSFMLDPALATVRRRWSLWPVFGGLAAALVAVLFTSQLLVSPPNTPMMEASNAQSAGVPQPADIALLATSAPAATAAPAMPAAASAPIDPAASKLPDAGAMTAGGASADAAAALSTTAPPDLSAARSSSPDTRVLELPVPPVVAAAPLDRLPIFAGLALLALGGAALVVWLRWRAR